MSGVRRPLIAVPAMRSPRIAGLRRAGFAVAERIAECILRGGGEPVVLVPGDPREVPERLAAFDGVLVPGGRDVDPARYGQGSRHPRTDEPDAVQDEADLAVIRAAVALGLPTLAICRGLQLLNVACGGTLVQHLGDDGPHREGFHPVDLDPGSRIAALMGGEHVSVSSYHHQAVDRLGAGLAVVGRAGDGCVEAAVHTTAPVLGVQWHPEDDAHTAPHQQALFDALVDDARASTERSRISA